VAPCARSKKSLVGRCYLRELGVEANATERAVRGGQHRNRKTGIYRAAARGDSTYMRERAEAIARELRSGGVRPESGYSGVRQTRQEVERGWMAFAELMEREGQHDTAARSEDSLTECRQLELTGSLSRSRSLRPLASEHLLPDERRERSAFPRDAAADAPLSPVNSSVPRSRSPK
jgi:hypothetical protein